MYGNSSDRPNAARPSSGANRLPSPTPAAAAAWLAHACLTPAQRTALMQPDIRPDLRDELLRRGVRYLLDRSPLEQYFEQAVIQPTFAGRDKLSRGYCAQWAIIDGWLYLEALDAMWSDGTPARLTDLFPRTSGRVFAAWADGDYFARSGTITLPLKFSNGATLVMPAGAPMPKADVIDLNAVRTRRTQSSLV